MKKKILTVLICLFSVIAVSQYMGLGNTKERLVTKNSIQNMRPHMKLAGALIEKYGVDPKHQEMIELEISMAVNYRKDIPQEMLQEIYALERAE